MCKEALLKAYHGDGKDPSNHEMLLESAQSVGLDATQGRRVLESGEYADAVRAEVAEFQAMGIHPFHRSSSTTAIWSRAASRPRPLHRSSATCWRSGLADGSLNSGIGPVGHWMA